MFSHRAREALQGMPSSSQRSPSPQSRCRQAALIESYATDGETPPYRSATPIRVRARFC